MNAFIVLMLIALLWFAVWIMLACVQISGQISRMEEQREIERRRGEKDGL